MRAFSVDYRKRDGLAGAGGRISRGFWLVGVPRPVIVCRLFGHRPVVDGTKGFRGDDPGSRWVVCDRCGVRPEPQGRLDPAVWNIGARYTGRLVSEPLVRHGKGSPEDKREAGCFYPPGGWPRGMTGELGGQIVLGIRRNPRVGFSVKVGNVGSEHTLAADFHLPWIGSLYLHTERFGSWLARRLNPVGYHSRVIGVEVSGGHLRWRVWARRDEWSTSDPSWMRGSLEIDPRTLLFGPKRYAYDNVGEPVTVTVRMPHGDDHQVRLQLQRQTFGRKRGRKRLSWNVDWVARPGIATNRNGRGRVCGSGTTVPDAVVEAGTWPLEAADRIAVQLVADRCARDWLPDSREAFSPVASEAT